MHSLKLPLTRAGLGRASDYLIPAIGLMAVASAAYAGADTTFGPALTKFTDFLEGSALRSSRVMSRRWVTGWKLDEADRERLLSRFAPRFPDLIADHVTLRTGTNQNTPLPRETCGEVIGEIDDGAGVQALVVRIDGTTQRADGSTYHITWSLDRARGRRPVESNEVIARLGWRAIPDPIPIRLHPARF